MLTTADSADDNTMVKIFDDISQHCCFDDPNFGDNVIFEVLNCDWFIDVNFTPQEPP